MSKIKLGIIGCGAISGIYLKNCTQTFKENKVGTRYLGSYAETYYVQFLG